jgi:hypothetical protein
LVHWMLSTASSAVTSARHEQELSVGSNMLSVFWDVALRLLVRRTHQNVELKGVFGTAPRTLFHKLHRGAVLQKKLKFVEHSFMCSHNSTIFPRTECVELKPFS